MICTVISIFKAVVGIEGLTGDVSVSSLLQRVQVDGSSHGATCLWRGVEVKWMRLDEVDLINFEASHPSA